MYFSNFQKIFYDFPTKENQENTLHILTDITANVRVRKQVLENITLYDEYDILDGETPELIAEKIYGNPEYHWIIMLVNQRYDYIRDFPMSVGELYDYVVDKYGVEGKDRVHHYEKNGQIVEALATMSIPALAHSQMKKNDFIFTNTANARIEAISYKFNISNVSNRNKFAPFKSVKLYDAPLSTRTIDNYMGTANVYELNELDITVGNINLLSGKFAPDIASIFTESDDFKCNMTLNTTSQPIINVLVDYGRFISGDPATVRGFRFNDEGIQTLSNVVSYYVPQTDGFVLNDDYIPITNYEYELITNENKRRIKIISPRLVGQIVEEMKQLMAPR
jgi:hypothetical protein